MGQIVKLICPKKSIAVYIWDSGTGQTTNFKIFTICILICPSVPIFRGKGDMTRNLKVLGGPGCGKTFKLMSQYRELLAEGYTPEDITLITFRKSSAMDLINSTVQQSNHSIAALKEHVGTIHSICNRLAKPVLSEETKLMSNTDYLNFIKEYKYSNFVKLPSVKIEEEESVYSGNLFDLYTWLRNTNLPPEKYYKYPGAENVQLPGNKIPEFINNYNEFKTKNNRIDFSDMIQIVIDNKIDLDTPVLMMDEFQDLTAQMYALFNMWAPKREFVTIAGDPNQSIYGFWGGSPDYYNKWQAEECILMETHRLPEQIKQFGIKVLKMGGMTAPDTKAKSGYKNPITCLRFEDKKPTYRTELHLIRCNYQSGAVAMELATEGKLYTGISGWTEEEVELANAILAYRKGKLLEKNQIKILTSMFSPKIYGKSETKASINAMIDKKYKPDLRASAELLKPAILDSLVSDDPTLKMTTNSKIFTAKIKGILNRNKPLDIKEAYNRKILTIHGSKGLEADAVFLHTAITPKIWKATVLPCEEYSAEARVWYVGVTRAREALYIIKDAGNNWKLPAVGVEA